MIAAGIIGVQYSIYWMVIFGMLIIGVISFLDDRITLSNKLRLFFHLIAVSLLFQFLRIFVVFPIYFVVALYVLVIGTINAYNFMDGINGITGVYSLTVLTGLQIVNYTVINFVEPDIIWLPILACLVFLYFNFRKKAKCFAGDVGSITIAFWILFLLLKLVIDTGDYEYFLFLLVYGLDSVVTIIFRLIRRENIFEAHRTHFYQYLANEKKISHLYVATGYGLIQVLIIMAVIKFNTLSLIGTLFTILSASIIFVTLRFLIEGKDRLLGLSAK
ncbi:MAG: UDP-GlcNAc--UDP-phosphate GlcNAc-1-phosphate transferase [Sphingobacteriales bacterium]|nr:MAG: UDP-GlcNAc--UDP-phosphate GlcNAc-1-phosphate transferase [Sphingobacteriales bacterium]